MNNFFIPFCVSLLLLACSGQKAAKYKEDPRIPYGTERDFSQSPEQVLQATKFVLEELAQSPKISADAPDAIIQETGNRVELGWLEENSKDKYIEAKHNSEPKRVPLKVRHWYSVNISPSLTGTQVEVLLKEEVEQRDLKTGAHKGWKVAKADTGAVDSLLHKIRDRLNAQ